MSKWINIDDLPNGRVEWDDIFDTPSIDIVFCKECRHWYRAIDESGTIEYFNFSRCTKGHGGNGLEFYCADGERREP